MTVAATLAIVAAGYFLLISPKKAEAADLQTQTDKEASTQIGLRQQLTLLTADEKRAAQYQAQLTSLKVRMPDEAGEAAFIRELLTAASAAGVDLVEISPGVPVAAAQAAVAKPTPSATASDAAAESASPSATGTTPAAAAAIDPSLGVSVIPVTLRMTGTYSGIEDFLQRAGKFRRAFLVQGVNLAIAAPTVAAPTTQTSTGPAAAPLYSGRLTATLTGSIFAAGSPGLVGSIEGSVGATPTPIATPSGSTK